MTRHLGLWHSVGLRGPTTRRPRSARLCFYPTALRLITVIDRRTSPTSASVGHTGDDLRGRRSLFVGGSHVSLTSHGVEMA
jgi:hypothetical protein